VPRIPTLPERADDGPRQDDVELLAAVVRHARDAIALVDDERRYRLVNPAMCELVGHPEPDLLALRVDDVTPPEHRGALPAIWARFRCEGTLDGRFELLHRDGTRVPSEFRAVADVRPGLHLSVMRDVRIFDDPEASGAAEATLRSLEADLRRFFDQSQDAFVVYQLEPERRFEYLSRAVERFTGYTVAELYGEPELRHLVLHPDDVEAYRAALATTAPDTPLTMRWRHRDGSFRWVEARGRLRRDARDGTVRIEAVVRDVTAQHQVEQALRSALAAEQEAGGLRRALLQAVTHELRTPLTTIMGFGEVLEGRFDDLDRGQIRRLARRMTANARRLDGLALGLLDLEQAGHGPVRLERRRVLIRPLVEEVLLDVGTVDHPVTQDVDDDLVVAVDGLRVRRLLTHLVENAVRHTPPGTPIHVEAQQTAGGLELRVEDRGPGIPPDQRDRLFEPFTLGPSPQVEAGGAGLGLAVVARYAELHGGQAWIEDAPGGGTAVVVRLPGADRAAPVPQ
jgi:PAS domain S-box-containing protein